MPNFTVDAVLLFHLPVRATSRRQAVAQFRKDYPNTVIQAVGGERVIGYCCASGQPVFSDDTFRIIDEHTLVLAEYDSQSKTKSTHDRPHPD